MSDPNPTPTPRKPWLTKMRRSILLSCSVPVAIVLIAILLPREPGADWFAPIDGPQSNEWQQATLPAIKPTPLTNDTLGVECKLSTTPEGRQEVIITQLNKNSLPLFSSRFGYADLIRADTNNTATLPDGTSIRLAEITAYLISQPPRSFKLGNDSYTHAVTTAEESLRTSVPILQLAFDQASPAPPVFLRDFAVYESSSGLKISEVGGGIPLSNYKLLFSGQSPTGGRQKITFASPCLLQSSLYLLLECHSGKPQQLTIPAAPGSFVEQDGQVIRYCDSFVRKAGEITEFTFWKGGVRNDRAKSGGIDPDDYSSTSPQGLDKRIFIFTHAIGSLEILAAEATLENGTKVSLSIDSSFREEPSLSTLRMPATITTPIRSFTLTLPQTSTRIIFTIPQIQELWPDQHVKNRFDLRLSVEDAARFQQDIRSYWGWGATLYKTTGARLEPSLSSANAFGRSSPQAPISLADIDLTGKTLREALALYIQRCGEMPDDFTTALDLYGNLIFERRKPRGVYIWRWLHREHRTTLQWMRSHGLDKWLEKVGIKDG